MKKTLLLLFTLFTALSSSYATHLMGGEIIAKQLVDSTYEIKLTVYRDTLGIPMDQIAQFEVRDTSGTVIMTFSTHQDTSVSGSLLPLYPYGVEVYCFIDTITLPGSGEYHISFNDCCRNGAIQNMSKPLSESMHLTTTITSFDSTANSTPFFLVRPVIFLPVNVAWNYNPLPFDPNGDSLVYSVDTSLTAHNTNVLGFTTPPGTSTGGFSIDPVTSTISWTANTIGNFVATVLTEEYRDGVKIGEIRRDMQFIVVNPTSSIPMMTNMNEVPTDNLGNYHVGLRAEERYEFAFYAEDIDSADVVSFEAFGEPFLFASDRAKFTVQKTGKRYGNEVEGLFVWSPAKNMIRPKPYLVVYRVSDGIFANDETILYSVYENVEVPTGIFETTANNGIGKVFPNPLLNELNVPVNMKQAGYLSVSLYNQTGQEVYDLGKVNLPKGNSVLKKQILLNEGNYFIVFKKDNKIINTQQISVLR